MYGDKTFDGATALSYSLPASTRARSKLRLLFFDTYCRKYYHSTASLAVVISIKAERKSGIQSDNIDASMYFRWIKYLFPNLIRGNIGSFVGSVKSRCITRKNGREDIRDNLLKFEHVNIPESVLEVPPPDGGAEIAFNEFQKEGLRAIDVQSGFTNRLFISLQFSR